MREKLKNIVRKGGKSKTVEGFVTWLINRYNEINPQLLPKISRTGLQFPLKVTDEVARTLDEIPSETTPEERRFLYLFFSAIWGGDYDVIEIGPFLGGTSRAIALGMCANPRVSDTSKLITFDRFYNYYDLNTLKEYLKPLFDARILDKDDMNSMTDSAEFMDIFRKIHEKHDYYKRIIPCDKGVPDKPQDLSGDRQYLTFSDRSFTDAVFIDGCKSWYGTKYFMREISRITRPGACFLFQDYGWYTCFWIPAFIELFKDYFRFFCSVDTTYVFTLIKTIEPEVINSYYPDEPEGLGAERLGEIFENRIQDALFRDDYFAVVVNTLHKAGALAYIGKTNHAKEIIRTINKYSWAVKYNNIIHAALRSPTYRPGGEQVVLE